MKNNNKQGKTTIIRALDSITDLPLPKRVQIRKQFIAEVEKIGIDKSVELTGLSNNFILKVMAGRFFVSPRTLLTVRGVK